MGIHLDRGMLETVREIMRWAPPTTILASATLPGWDQLPSWWKGKGQPATRTVISMVRGRGGARELLTDRSSGIE